jgi:hypothetical protein
MQFKQTTILGLFDSSQKHFIIPVYQRAYSWDYKNLSIFLSDLKEQIQGENGYFYGNILLETVKKDVEYEIIDGQQRLTTIIIFMSAILDVLSKRQLDNFKDLDIPQKKSIYLKNAGNIKLRTVDYDRACFETLIIDGHEKFKLSTPSQIRIYETKKYFKKELGSLETSDLVKILDLLETTEITSIELNSKADSALMFELQNNRGKDLTNMEKLKSYFMYQMYVNSKAEETINNIEYIAEVFKSIYLTINDITSLDEDSVLIYHCNAYIKGYPYRTIEDIKEVYLKSSSKILWIREFVKELCISFDNIKRVERSNLKYLKDLRDLSMPRFIFPFIIKGYKYFGDDNTQLNKLYHILEIASFRYKLVSSKADFLSRINEILLGFEGDLNILKNHFKNKFNETWHWSDDRTKDVLDGNMYQNPTIHYILLKYENHIQNKGYKIEGVEMDSINIEHISPKTPPNDEKIAHGYETDSKNQYDEEFTNEYLNCLGNLMLIAESHNKSIGNNPFKDKLDSYNKNPLFNQQAEIKRFIKDENNPTWDKEAIDERHISIVDNFALIKWSFDNVVNN